MAEVERHVLEAGHCEFRPNYSTVPERGAGAFSVGNGGFDDTTAAKSDTSSYLAHMRCASQGAPMHGMCQKDMGLVGALSHRNPRKHDGPAPREIWPVDLIGRDGGIRTRDP
jgi:hypothetical protein